jgi:coatomer protein complex subunit gamma
VFAFTVTNTVPDMLLERVSVVMQPSEPGAWKHVVTVSAPRIREGAPGTVYVCLARHADAGFGAASFSTEVRFVARECDPGTGEPVGDATAEQYPVNDVELSPADYVAKVAVPDFRAAWEALGADGEVVETFGLSFKSVADAVASVTDVLGLVPCDGTGAVKPGVAKHSAYLSGVFLGDIQVLARVLVRSDSV